MVEFWKRSVFRDVKGCEGEGCEDSCGFKFFSFSWFDLLSCTLTWVRVEVRDVKTAVDLNFLVFHGLISFRVP